MAITKKVLILMLVLGMTSLANASVIDVIVAGEGSLGHTGASTDPVAPGEIIEIKIVLNADPDPTWYYGGGYPAYDGYWLSSMDLNLEISGPAVLALDAKGIQHNPGFDFWDGPIIQIWPPIIGIIGTAPGDGLQGPVDLVWNILLECGATGPFMVDLTNINPGDYSEYANSVGGPWIPLTEEDLGDLIIHAGLGPEPPPSCWDCPTQCHGDSNCDGFVDTGDWPAFRDSFYKCYPDPDYDPCADSNRDGCVDTADWPPFRDYFYQSPPGDCTPGGPWPPE